MAKHEHARMYRDRPSRRVLNAETPKLVEVAPYCPRCDTPATGQGGRWWCSECSTPVSLPRI